MPPLKFTLCDIYKPSVKRTLSIYYHYYYLPSLREAAPSPRRRKNRERESVFLRSKRFRAVSEQRTRNKSQRPREKWGEYVKKFHFLALVPFFRKIRPSIFFCSETKRKRLLRRLLLTIRGYGFYQAFDTLLTTVKRFFLCQGTAWYSFNCTLNDGRAKLSSNLVNMAGDLLYKVPLTLWLPLLWFFGYQLSQGRII